MTSAEEEVYSHIASAFNEDRPHLRQPPTYDIIRALSKSNKADSWHPLATSQLLFVSLRAFALLLSLRRGALKLFESF